MKECPLIKKECMEDKCELYDEEEEDCILWGIYACLMSMSGEDEEEVID